MPQTKEEMIAADPSVWVEIDGEMVPNYDATIADFSEGDVVTGKVVRIDKDEVLIDIGYKSEGVIPVAELSIRRSVDPGDEVEMGEEVDALVMQKEDADGRLILSKKRARFEKAWKRIEAAAESGEAVTGSVIEVVKGGLIIDLGVRGFLPASLVDIRRVQDLEEFRGQELRCKVIELNRSRNNVVLSRRAMLEEERREVRQRILDDLLPGKTVTGVVSNIVDFGAFVDLDGIDGLIHISELSWSHVNHPSELLEIGQEVEVKVLDVDRDRQRISLGLKQTQSDPWQRVLSSYQQGDVVHGRATKVVTFGAFVEILQGVEGLVHISELAERHVENPREVVSQGDHVLVRIIEVDPERRRLSLSMKQVLPGDPVVAPISLVPGGDPFIDPNEPVAEGGGSGDLSLDTVEEGEYDLEGLLPPGMAAELAAAVAAEQAAAVAGEVVEAVAEEAAEAVSEEAAEIEAVVEESAEAEAPAEADDQA
ncbi:MAG: 30S ribosomal protein S1 [Actinobacteria bacterium]|nr:30S ribosomal protein S1 [Actinomycetota bacterium]